MKRMKQNKDRELPRISVQQPTGHRIVVESPRQSLAKKKKKKKKKKKNKVALKMARMQC